MKAVLRFSWAVGLILVLAACGFTPVYATRGDNAVKYHLDSIYIGNIPDSEGQYLRNALIDRFYQSGRPADPQYELAFEPLKERERNLDITRTSDATRRQIRMDTAFTLKDRKSGEVLLTRKILSMTSYNVLDSQFTTRISQDDARKGALDDLARQVEQQLALYFSGEIGR